MKILAFIIGGIIGGIIGAEAWGGIGFLIGALAGVLLVHWLAPQSLGKLDELERRVASLEAETRALAARFSSEQPVPEHAVAVEPDPAPVVEPVIWAAPVLTAGGELVAPAAAPAPAPAVASFATAASTAAAPESIPLQPSKLWAWLSGGNAMVRVGVVVLFFGVAFLIKFAAEHVHVPIETRLTGIALGAVAMLLAGWRLRERKGGYGLVLQGGGIGVLYLVVFGALRIWHLIPAEIAFVLLIVLAFASAALAVLQDSRSLAIAGFSGGFLAPILASTGHGSHVMLFGFYLVLNLGIIAVAWHKAWRSLNIVGFVFTFLIGAIWGAQFYRPEHYETMQPFLAAFFLLYVAVAVLFGLKRAPRLTDYVDSIIVFGNPLAAGGLQLALVKDFEYGAAWSAVAVGAFYLVLAYRLWREKRESLQLLVECLLALGVAFATLAIPFAFDGRSTAASWALEGAAAYWVGVRQRRWLPRLLGLVLQPAAGIAFLGASDSYVAALPVLNSRFIGGLTIALSGLFCAWYTFCKRDSISETEKALPALAFIWGAAWWLGAGWHEISLFGVPQHVRDYQLLYATASALGFGFLRRKLDWSIAAYGALALLPIMVLYAGFMVDLRAHPLADLGLLAWPLAFAAIYVVLARHESDYEGKIARGGHCVALWLLAALTGWECSWQLDELVGDGRIWSQIGRPLVPALLAAWIATRDEDTHWPLSAHYRTYTVHAVAPIMVALWLWILYINFASDGNPKPLPYVPLLNPLDVAIGLIAVIFMQWRRTIERLTPTGLEALARGTMAWVGATGFIWANGVLLRTLHHWAEVPFRIEQMLRSTLVQASFSVFWTLLALGGMVFANRRRIRPLWVCGAALLAVVVVKLFLVDLQKISGVERIVSFLGVGVLMLVIGYLAPAPPRAEEKSK